MINEQLILIILFGRVYFFPYATCQLRRMSSFKFLPGMVSRPFMKLTGLLIITIILVISPVLITTTTVLASPDLDTTGSIQKCAAKNINDLYGNTGHHQSICIPSDLTVPMTPFFSGANCQISAYSINCTDLKFFLMTILIFAVPLPLFRFLKGKLTQAPCMSQRIFWGILLFFLIASATIHVTELEGNRNKILRSLANATGSQNYCDEIRDTADLEIMNIFLEVNPLNSVYKTVHILMDALERGRQRSRVTKVLKQLEMGGEKEDDAT